MGGATITGGGPDGLYTIDLDFGAERNQKTLDNLDAQIARIDEAITEADAALSDAQAVVDATAADMNAAIVAYNAALLLYADYQAFPENYEEPVPKPDATAMTAVAEKLVIESELRTNARLKLENLRVQRLALVKIRAEYAAAETEDTRQVWCADLTENASGAVATAEVPGEPQNIIILPGGRAPTDADGFLLARGVMSPEQAYFNAAILPGWQKFKPTYRVGVISNLDFDAHTCSVSLDAATSSAQDLPINVQATLSGIPVQYMTCNARAFADGDRVLVEFPGQNWDSPRVIGFESNPKPCVSWPSALSWSLLIQDDFDADAYAASPTFPHTYTQPDEIGGNEVTINLHDYSYLSWIEIVSQSNIPEGFTLLTAIPPELVEATAVGWSGGILGTFFEGQGYLPNSPGHWQGNTIPLFAVNSALTIGTRTLSVTGTGLFNTATEYEINSTDAGEVQAKLLATMPAAVSLRHDDSGQTRAYEFDELQMGFGLPMVYLLPEE